VELPVRAGDVAVLEEEELDLPEARVVDLERVGPGPFRPSARVTLNVDHVVRLTSTVWLNPDVALWTILTLTRSTRIVQLTVSDS